MRFSNVNRWLKVLLAVLFSLSITGVSYAQTMSGTLASDETWSGIVTLTGDVTVPVGVTLTINSGTEVVFPAGSDDTSGGEETGLTELIVNGSLSAVGEEGNEIVFRSSSGTPAKGDWGGIRAAWGIGAETFNIQYCNISYASAGVRWVVQSGVQNTTISNCTIEQTSTSGIYVYSLTGADLSVTLDGNVVTGHTNHGIYVYVNGTSSRMGGTINGNTVTDNGIHGLYLRAYGGTAADPALIDNMDVSGNTIRDNGQIGIYVRSRNYGEANATVHDNLEISGSGTYGIRVSTNQYGKSDVNITGNPVTGSGSHGIYVETNTENSGYYYGQSQFLIHDNDVHDNTGHGI
ncbi:MAG: right-handed parallel beta-helix repeat-containing protein, partial [bacterium]|nr:right-handed parallel beta-helix repeat-containing protein [bacterium]